MFNKIAHVYTVLHIRIGNPDPDPGAIKLKNFIGKNALFGYLKKFYH
jgi:hypothetical protein